MTNNVPSRFSDIGQGQWAGFKPPEWSPVPAGGFVGNVGNIGHRETVVVIGASYAGLSAALELVNQNKEKGLKTNVIVLEAKTIGDSPSGKSGGHICGFQAEEREILAHCGKGLGQQLLDRNPVIVDGVRELVAREGINCGLEERDGYIWVTRKDKQQELIDDGSSYAIEPYKYLMGLAKAASDKGAKIYEGVKVTGVDSTNPDYCIVNTSQGPIKAGHVIAAGGYGMARQLKEVRNLVKQTVELSIVTIRIPIDEEMLRRIMPAAEGKPLSGCDDARNVQWWSVYPSGEGKYELLTGTRITARESGVNPQKIFDSLVELMPDLRGSSFAVEQNEKLLFTGNLLPSAGVAGDNNRIMYASTFGGHGVAVGTDMGKAIADNIVGAKVGDPTLQETFKLYADVHHAGSSLMLIDAFRKAAAAAGVAALNVGNGALLNLKTWALEKVPEALRRYNRANRNQPN